MYGQGICYRGGYKYQLIHPYRIATGIAPPIDIRTDWLHMSEEGILNILAGYAWDGPSGQRSMSLPSCARAWCMTRCIS